MSVGSFLVFFFKEMKAIVGLTVRCVPPDMTKCDSLIKRKEIKQNKHILLFTYLNLIKMNVLWFLLRA